MQNFPKKSLGIFPTPLHHHPELADVLGLDELLVKRDDLSGFGWGGNKVRTIEYLIGDALERGADTLVMASGASSNFAATMAHAAVGAGLSVEQVCHGNEPERTPVGLLSTRRLGGTTIFTGSDDRSSMERVAGERGEAIAAEGRIAYVVPRGGATPTGSLGFVAAAFELAEQLKEQNLQPAHLVIGVGSGGSAAGLIAGLSQLDLPLNLLGVSVSRPADDISTAIASHAAACAELVGATFDNPPDFTIFDGQGDGYGIARPEETELAERIERRCGLVLDPVYTAKTIHWLAGAVAGTGSGSADTAISGPVLYWHTGGALGAADHLSKYSAS